MFIILKGSGGGLEVAKALRLYYGYRGTACYSYDYFTPAREAYEAVEIVLNGYGMRFPDESSMGPERLFPWLLPFLPKITATRVRQVVSKWVELKMFFVCVIYNSIDAPTLLEPYFKVHISEFDNPEPGTVFDLHLCSKDSTATQLAESIGAALHRRLFGDKAHSLIQDESSADAQ